MPAISVTGSSSPAPPGVLECFVRPRGTKPPLPQPWIGRVSATLLLNVINIVWFHVVAFPLYPFWLSFGSFMLVCQLTMIMDGLVSNSFGRNITNLRKAGYSDTVTLAFLEFNLFSSQLIGYFFMTVVITDSRVFTWDYVRERLVDDSGLLLGALVINLAISDVLFTVAHRALHTHPRLVPHHVFHHCSTNSSWNTNLLFHPVDLALEFAGPAGGLLFMHYTVWQQDPLVLVVTYIIFQLWYAFDHDEGLKLYHTLHHRACNHLYSVYTPFKASNGALTNILRTHMKEKHNIDIVKGGQPD
jgi:sterol desaturase/sphingolipid hydroxylase (fatty acid hydroxylase superfamily)